MNWQQRLADDARLAWQQRVRATHLENPPPPPDEHAGSISAWRRGWIACWRGAHRSECRHKATRLVAAWQAGYAACAVAMEDGK